VTEPVLWDKKRQTIVSNESAEIIRMFNRAFDGLTGSTDDFCPEELRADIDAINAKIYDTVNNGVYKAGFATTQEAYESAVLPLFETLDWLDDRLSTQRYLFGDRLTEADWRLFTTLVRFDAVYVASSSATSAGSRLSEPLGLLRDHSRCGRRRHSQHGHIKAHINRSNKSITRPWGCRRTELDLDGRTAARRSPKRALQRCLAGPPR